MVAPVPSVTVSDWSIVLSWMPVAIASASTVCVIMTPWSAIAWEVEPLDSRLALTAASIGNTTLAFRAMARSMGAAPSMARSISAARSRIETTSLSGSAVTPSAANSSVSTVRTRRCSSRLPSLAARHVRQNASSHGPTRPCYGLPRVLCRDLAARHNR